MEVASLWRPGLRSHRMPAFFGPKQVTKPLQIRRRNTWTPPLAGRDCKVVTRTGEMSVAVLVIDLPQVLLYVILYFETTL